MFGPVRHPSPKRDVSEANLEAEEELGVGRSQQAKAALRHKTAHGKAAAGVAAPGGAANLQADDDDKLTLPLLSASPGSKMWRKPLPSTKTRSALTLDPRTLPL